MSGPERDERRQQVGTPGAPSPSDTQPTDATPATRELAGDTQPHPGPIELSPDAVETWRPPPRRRPRGLGPQETGVLVVLVVVLAVIGIVVAALAQDDDPERPAAVASTTTVTLPTTTTSTTAPPIDRGADPVLTAQVREALDEEVPGTGNVVSGVYLNLLGNLKVDTNLANSRASADRALTICQVGKSLGYTDVEVRSSTGRNLASTGLLDNSCSRHD